MFLYYTHTINKQINVNSAPEFCSRRESASLCVADLRCRVLSFEDEVMFSEFHPGY